MKNMIVNNEIVGAVHTKTALFWSNCSNACYWLCFFGTYSNWKLRSLFQLCWSFNNQTKNVLCNIIILYCFFAYRFPHSQPLSGVRVQQNSYLCWMSIPNKCERWEIVTLMCVADFLVPHKHHRQCCRCARSPLHLAPIASAQQIGEHRGPHPEVR